MLHAAALPHAAAHLPDLDMSTTSLQRRRMFSPSHGNMLIPQASVLGSGQRFGG